MTGAISGLTLNLASVSTGTPPAAATVTVGTNSTGLQTSIQSFVDSYNTLMNTINSLSKATADKDGKLTVQAAFTGDSMPRALISDIRGVLTAPGAGGPLAVLSQIGVMTDQNTGNLAFDTTAFNKTMSTSGMSGQVQQLFSGTDATNGLLARMGKAITPYVQTGGLLDQRNSNLQTVSKTLSDQQAALDLRVTNMTATLTAKYNAMDLLVGQMKATASSITSFFTSLNAQKSNG